MDATTIGPRLRDYFARESHGAVAVYLFGSVARATATSRSDVDVAVLFADAPPRTLEGLPVQLQAELERHVGHSVDLVVLNHAGPDLVHRVLRDGLIVFEADRSARIRFEVRARAEYFDLLPILEEYRRARPSRPRSQ